jgi:hypothetical protein
MLQLNEIKQHFGRIERDIDEAANTCKSDTKLPQQLKEYVMQWKQQAANAKSIFDSHDNARIRLCIDDLEQIGERAEAALKDVAGTDTKIKNPVMHAHSELAELKRNLH